MRENIIVSIKWLELSLDHRETSQILYESLYSSFPSNQIHSYFEWIFCYFLYNRFMQKDRLHNVAFIDGQNLYRWLDWDLDFQRFRIYLHDKYHIEEAYYFIGYDDQSGLYTSLQKAGFIVIFNPHKESQISSKKWNVDVNLAFHMMKTLIEGNVGNIMLISGDGDYKPVVDYLIEKNRFLRILAPNMKYCSSLYKKWSNFPKQYISTLADLQSLLQYHKK